MAWIHTPSDLPGEQDDDARLRELHGRSRDPHSGRVDAILAVHGLHPAGLAAHLELYRAVMRGTPGLPTLERELVAFVVSAANGCGY